MPGSAGDGPKTQEGTPATKDTNTTLPLPSFDPFSKQNPTTAYYPRAAQCLSALSRYGSAVPTPPMQKHQAEDDF